MSKSLEIRSFCFLTFLMFVASALFAERIVKGKITDHTGAPVSGIRVKAIDEDYGSEDDEMGDPAMTDGSGNYAISYPGGHWDSAPHGWTIWRPDIFIRVSAQTRGNCEDGEWIADKRWVHVQDSGVTEDHPLRNDLTKNLKLSEGNYPLSTVVVGSFELGTTMYCSSVFGFTDCFGCTKDGKKISWEEFEIANFRKRTRCDSPPLPDCSDADWKKIEKLGKEMREQQTQPRR